MTNFGATIVPTAPKSNPAMLDSPVLTPAVSHDDLQGSYNADNKPIPPHSPFYQHPPASFEGASKTDVSTVQANEKDLEANTPLAVPTDDHPFASKVSVDCSKECRMWPSKQTLQQETQGRRKQKRSKKTLGRVTGPISDFWDQSSKRQRLYVQIGLALLLVGIVVAIAVGITVAVNGTVYVGENQSKNIPNPSR